MTDKTRAELLAQAADELDAAILDPVTLDDLVVPAVANKISAIADALRAQADAMHPDDAAVDALAEKMRSKLARKREQGYGGWETCHPDRLRKLLITHLAKGDPVDVANFCAMLEARGERTDYKIPQTLQEQTEAAGEPVPVAWRITLSGPERAFAYAEHDLAGTYKSEPLYLSPPADRARELLKEALEQLESTDYQADIELRIAAFLKETP